MKTASPEFAALTTPEEVAAAVDRMHVQFTELRRQIAGVIVGQDEVAEQY